MRHKSTVCFSRGAPIEFEWEDFEETSQFDAAISALKRRGYFRGLTRSPRAYYFNEENFTLEYKDGRVLGTFEVY